MILPVRAGLVLPLLRVAIFVFFLPTSCGSPDILVLSDQYWWETDVTVDVQQDLVSDARAEGTTIEFLSVDFPTDPGVLTRSVLEIDPGITLLSPLLSQFGIQLARQNADRRFVAFDLGLRNPLGAENLFTIGTDRSPAYMSAGALCRSFLDDPAHTALKVAAFFYAGGAERFAEREAFLNGIDGQSDGRVIIRSFPRLDAVGEINEAISGLKEEGIGLFFVSMSAMTQGVISNISSQMPSKIISEWSGGASRAAYGDRIVATIEEHWLHAVDGSIKSLNSDIMVETNLVSGPARGDEAWLDGL